MKEAIAITMFFIVLMMSFLAFGSSDIPTETPPCPEEYKNGLKP